MLYWGIGGRGVGDIGLLGRGGWVNSPYPGV